MLDCLARLAHRGGKRVLFLIEGLPLAAVVEFHQMTERAARAKQLPLRILALGIRGQSWS